MNLAEQAMGELATLRERPLLVVYQDQTDDEDLSPPYTTLIHGIVREAASEIREYGKVSVLVDSPGGDIEEVFRILKAIRDCADDVEALVPNWAKSAATFFCLGADKMYLGPDGELGPLDPQIADPRGGARPRSPLETFQALEQLRNYSLEALDSIVQLLIRRTRMDIPYALEQAEPLLSAIVTPIYSQVDPHELGEMGRRLAVSEEYAKLTMRRWSYPEKDDHELTEMVDRLVREYPTHGFVIDLDEARNIGLKAERLDEESDILCKRLLRGVDGCVGLVLPSTQDSDHDSETGSRAEEEPIPMEAIGEEANKDGRDNRVQSTA